jgi:hypothetical protein
VRDFGHSVAEVRDHVVKHLADEKVVLDDKNARRTQRIVCHVLIANAMPRRILLRGRTAPVSGK